MKKGYLLVITLSLLITGVFSLVHTTQALTVPYGFIFLYDMKQGTTLTDVKYLQEVLNSDSRTQVTDTGFGSPGNETTYFGEKTKNAVIRFQELYAADILVPNNLTVGTGFVGQSTRNKLNSVLESLHTNDSSESTSNTSSDSEEVSKKKSIESNKDSTHSIFTEQSLQESASDTERPLLTKVTPEIIKTATKKISIEGSNFDTNDNVIYGTLGEIKALPSRDNTTLTFTLQDFSSFSQAKTYYAGQTINIYMRVANQYGQSADFAVVQYAFPGAQATSPDSQSSETTSATTSPNNTSSQSGCGTNKSCSTQNSSSTSNSSNSLGITSQIGETDKMIWGFSPQGMLIKQIGGEELFNTVYSFSPSGTLLGGGSSSGSNSNNSSGSSAGALGGALGASALGGESGGNTTGGTTGYIDYFGGNITQVTYCTCSGGVLLYIQDKVTNSQKQLVYQYGASQLRANYNVFTAGPNVIGGFYQGGICEVYSGNSCTSEGSPQGTIDYIRGIGTSLE